MFVPRPLVWNTLFTTEQLHCLYSFALELDEFPLVRDSHVRLAFYHHLRCEVTGVSSVIAVGGSNRRWQLN